MDKLRKFVTIRGLQKNMLINAEKHLDIFKKIVEISRCFVQKI